MAGANQKSLRGESDWSTRPLGDPWGETLRAELLSWPGVKLRPMMGTLAFFKGPAFIGCYVNRDLVRSKPDWVNRAGEPTYACVRLRTEDAARALRHPGLRQSRLEFAGWVEIPLASRKLYDEAVNWFSRAYEFPVRPRSKKPRSRRASGRRR
jgi:hypothetical protein